MLIVIAKGKRGYASPAIDGLSHIPGELVPSGMCFLGG